MNDQRYGVIQNIQGRLFTAAAAVCGAARPTTPSCARPSRCPHARAEPSLDELSAVTRRRLDKKALLLEIDMRAIGSFQDHCSRSRR